MAFEPPVDYIADIIRGRQKEKNKNIIIAVGGPGGSGKSTLAAQLQKQLPGSAVLHVDDYRLPRSERTKNQLGSNPKSNKLNLLSSHLESIRLNESFDKPVYNSVTGVAESKETYLPGLINIVDGELSTIKKLTSHIDFYIFVKVSLLNQLSYRVNRDRTDRKYSLAKSLNIFLRSNLIDYKIYNYGAKARADIIVNPNFSKEKFAFGPIPKIRDRG